MRNPEVQAAMDKLKPLPMSLSVNFEKSHAFVLLDYIAQLEKATEWQTIETAPYCQNGKRKPWVLVSRITESGFGPVISAYKARAKSGSKKRVWYVNGHTYLHFEPTHWQTLPTPPKEVAQMDKAPEWFWKLNNIAACEGDPDQIVAFVRTLDLYVCSTK